MSWSNSNGDTVPTGIGDTFTGTAGDDIPDSGLGGNDTLEGDGGSDSLTGGEDDDLLTDSAGGGNLNGGDGNDTILMTLEGAAGFNFARAFGGEGDDLIIVTGAGLLTRTDTIGVSADGNGGNDTILAGDSRDELQGRDGNDSIDAGAGNDGAYGGDGNDTIDGGAGDDVIFGDDGSGSSVGHDSLAGGEGNDILYGEDGDDTLSGGAGIDSLFGGTGANALDFSDATTGVEMVMGQGDIYNDGFDNEESYEENAFTVAYGSQHADGFFAGSGAADSLFGQAGDDRLFGGGDADTLSGGDDNDLATGEEGSDLVFGDGGNDTLVGGRVDLNTYVVEPGGDPDGSDTLLGGEGDDSILGVEGDDSLDGGYGHDTLDGGIGSDVIEGGDSIEYGEEGNIVGIIRESDMVTYQSSGEAISFSLTDGNGVVQAGSEGTDELRNIEQVVGSGFGDSMEMFWGAPETIDILLDGGAGNDAISLIGDAAATLAGGTGDDTISGGNGDDTILGGDGNDSVYGGAGADSILATPGRDTIEGGTGNDVIDTGEEDDLVLWRAGDGSDEIRMGTGSDTLNLQGWQSDWTIDAADTLAGNYTLTYIPDGSVLTVTGVEHITCFAEGTRILTPRGEVPVETLRAGDLVVAGTGFKPLRWVGHTRVDVARHGAKAKVAPILLRAGALGSGVPHRALRVSPEHAFLLQGRLVPAHLLVNDTTIVQEAWQRTLTYWHLELDAHDVVVAEGTLAESYFDDGNRHLFDNAVVALHPDFGAGRQGGRYAAEACAPPVLSQDDPALAAIVAALPAPEPVARRA